MPNIDYVDEEIREGLVSARKEGKLSITAEVSSIGGGEEFLNDFINGDAELDILSRGILSACI